MQSFLITGGTDETRLQKALDMCAKYAIDPIDRVFLTKGTQPGKEGKLKASLGIDEVKLLQKNLALKPLKGIHKAILITEASLLTNEAQNALLKVLEEPPNHTYFILLAPSQDTLLPTVISRCQIIKLEHVVAVLTSDEEKLFSEIAKTITDWGPGRALKQAEALAKNKEEAIIWLEKLTFTLRNQALLLSQENQPKQLTVTIRQIHKLEKVRTTLLSTNANPRLLLEACFLSLSS